MRFHALPEVARRDIVLADGVLERAELHTIRFAAHADRLLAAGRHLRRGLLLHGKPGTGKTLTAMYPARQQPDQAVLLVTGRTVGLLRRSCELARLLELYGRGLTLRVSAMDQLVERTEGVSPAFIRELLRKAALLAVGPATRSWSRTAISPRRSGELVADGQRGHPAAARVVRKLTKRPGHRYPWRSVHSTLRQDFIARRHISES